MCDAAERLVTKEAKAVSGLTKHLREGHANVFTRKVGEFYDKHEKQVQDSFRPALTALQSAIGRQVAEERDGDGELSDDAAVGAYAQKLAGRHCQHAKQAIAEMLTGEKDSTQAADAIDARMKEWQEKKPAGESDYELRQAQNFFAREAYRAAGCKSVAWKYAAGDPEECRALDGKTVAIDEPFQADPLRMHPPLRSECRCGIVGVRDEVRCEHRANDNHDEKGLFAASPGSGKTSPNLSVKREGDKWIAHDGSSLPEHIAATYIPPAWTSVKVNADPNAALLVTGKDAKGRPQSIYSQNHVTQQAAAKMARTSELIKKTDAIRQQNEANLLHGDAKVREAAAVTKLIQETGIRPGSDRDTKADKLAYGATTLRAEHVVEEHGTIYLRFTGKKGVEQNIAIHDPSTATMLKDRAASALLTAGGSCLVRPLRSSRLLPYVGWRRI